MYQPSEGRLAFRDHAEPQEGCQRVGGIANPGIAVVIVLGAAETLRQRRRGGRRDGTGGREQKELQHQRAAPDGFTIRPVIMQPARPRAPSLVGEVDAGVHVGEGRHAERLVLTRQDGHQGSLAREERALGHDRAVLLLEDLHVGRGAE